MPAETGKCLFAYYDFQVATVSFDFVAYIGLARLHAGQTGCSRLHVIFVPGPKDGFRDDDVGYDLTEKRQRLYNILLPLCTMQDLPVSISLCQTRTEAERLFAGAAGPVFPEGYTPENPVASIVFSGFAAAHATGETIPSLRANAFALRMAKDWLAHHTGGREPIVITLREAGHSPTRNSNTDDWIAFADRVDHARFAPVFVRDTASATEELPAAFKDHLICPIAPFDLNFRHALYELAYLNLTVPNGPTSICWLNNRSRFLCFKFVTESASETSTIFHTSMGLAIGGQAPFATRYQRLVWEEDSLDVIEREFAAMVERIDAGAEDATAPDPDKAEDPMAVAVRLQATGRLEEAITVYQSIVTKDPNNPDAWHMLGLIACQANRPDAAEKMILRAISLKPDQANYFINLSSVLRQLERTEEAANCLWRAIALSPNDAGAHADLAELLRDQGADDAAKSALLKAIRIRPNSPGLCERAAVVLHELGHIEEAANLYRRAITLREKGRAELRRRLPEVPSLTLKEA
jgi:tetratricopeptide (TPR) repeat protein